MMLYSSAAVIVLFISFYTFAPSNQSPEKLYYKYLEPLEMPITRSSDRIEQQLVKAGSHLNKNEYAEAYPIFSGLMESGYRTPAIYINLAVCQIETGALEEAEATLNGFIQSDLLDSEKGFWYKSLLYLKSGKIDKSGSVLIQIVENNYFNHQLAKELLREIR